MKFHVVATLLFTAFFGVHATANTTVYKSVGKHGEMRFSQMQPSDTQKFEVLSIRSDGRTADAGRMAQPVEAPPPPSPESQRIAELEQQAREQKAKELADRCQSLRTNFANLTIGGKIFETKPNGERVFLNDQEISSRRQRHEQMINQYCRGM